jgi:peptidoglycan hydrolase-like protein with peptidoglycan-binding domain
MTSVFPRAALAASLLCVTATVASAQTVPPGTVPESALRGPTFALPDPAQPPQAQPQGQPQAPPPPAAAPSGRTGTWSLVPAYTAGLQRELAAHGYYRGPQNGLLDNPTKRAILAYQRDAGLAQDASSAAALQDTLNHVSFARPPVYAAGAVGGGSETVRMVQQQLAARGYEVGTADGVLGPATIRAIQQFQAASNLPTDGQIGPALLDRLR